MVRKLWKFILTGWYSPLCVRAEEISATKGKSIFNTIKRQGSRRLSCIDERRCWKECAEKGKHISLKGYDDIFLRKKQNGGKIQEHIQEIPLSELHPFGGASHQWLMMGNGENCPVIRDFGVLNASGVLESRRWLWNISGHRRHVRQTCRKGSTFNVVHWNGWWCGNYFWW